FGTGLPSREHTGAANSRSHNAVAWALRTLLPTGNCLPANTFNGTTLSLSGTNSTFGAANHPGTLAQNNASPPSRERGQDPKPGQTRPSGPSRTGAKPAP